jgi:iron-sulfur cluster repair protein YtfE (RIC family)
MQASRTGSRRFHEALKGEHVRLEATLAGLEWALRTGATDTARTQLATFEAGLNRYVHGEERLLFPMLEALVPSLFAPTARMRREHRSLRKLAAAVRDSVARGDGPRSVETLGMLQSVFLLHLAKEELIIYPLLHHAVSATAEEAFLQAIL